MYRKLVFSLCFVLISAGVAMAQEKEAKAVDGVKAVDGAKVANGNGGADAADGALGATGADGSDGSTGAPGVNGPDKADVVEGAGDSAAKTLSGMSVLGNDEAPMSLFIVPWKSSELGVETSLQRMLDERDAPVDRDVFMREVGFYQVSVGGETPNKN